MIANHIHDALAQVKTLREIILSKQFFRGYSGKARIMSGCAALMGAIIMSGDRFPKDDFSQLAGWCGVLLVGLLVNYTALLYWFFFDSEVRRNPVMLKPALDAIPALAIGGVLSMALLLYGVFDLFFGVWMSLYGLAQVAYRQSLPRGIYLVGLGYIICGAYFLLTPGVSFVNPWPMGIIFFVGEWIGGVVLILNEAKKEEEED